MDVKKVTFNKQRSMFFVVILMTMVMVMWGTMGVMVSAASTSKPDSAQAMKNLQSHVYNEVQGQTYETTEGGYRSGSELLTGTAQNGYELNEAVFSQLTSKEQSRAVSDIATASNNAVAENRGENYTKVDGDVTTDAGPKKGTTGVTDETVQTWWKTLQSKDGVGSKFLSTVLQDTKPDFVTASKWYKPFSGPIGTLLAFGSIIAMGLIGIVMVCDILYITIPPIRLFVDDQGNSEKMQTSKIFSHAAIHAVKTVEEGGSDKANKHALGIYFKSRVIELIILAICLLYLVNGKIYDLVGYILDLLSGVV